MRANTGTGSIQADAAKKHALQLLSNVDRARRHRALRASSLFDEGKCAGESGERRQHQRRTGGQTRQPYDDPVTAVEGATQSDSSLPNPAPSSGARNDQRARHATTSTSASAAGDPDSSSLRGRAQLDQ